MKRMNWNLLLLKMRTQKKSIIIVGVMYRHPSMDLTDFNITQLKELFENISKKQNIFSYMETLMLIS